MKKLLIISVIFSNFLFSKNQDWENFKMEKLSYLSQIEGWCSYEKAEKMMELIQQTHPTTCVEIGVYGGSSIYPTALALSYEGMGKVYAIDPWSKEECLKGYDPQDPNYIWWEMVDLEHIFQHFMKMLRNHNLTEFCEVMRMTSMAGAKYFPDESIDILHVDGNHTEDESYGDVYLFFPKVKTGGYIWLDDIKWTTSDGKNTLEKAFSLLLKQCDLVTKVDNGNCVLLKKR